MCSALICTRNQNHTNAKINYKIKTKPTQNQTNKNPQVVYSFTVAVVEDSGGSWLNFIADK